MKIVMGADCSPVGAMLEDLDSIVNTGSGTTRQRHWNTH